jgi:arylsulfatase
MNRLLLAALILGLVSPRLLAADAAARRPNIVIIMADDMGFSDLGCYGSEINTPNIDRLAASGLRFTQFYNTARCCPTRAALLTGMYSHQVGVGHMVEDRGKPAYRGFLNDRALTIGETLREAPYSTYLSGKWHVGEKPGHWPVDRGFDRSYALVSGGTNYFRLDPNRILARDGKRIEPPEDWYVTDAITDNAVTFLKEHPGDKPFFLYLAYTAPHWPLHAWPEDIAKYRGKYQLGWDKLRENRRQKMIELGLIDKRWPLTPRDPKVKAWADVPEKNRDAWDLKMAVYAAQIDRMDQGIGKLLAQLKAMNTDENTLVMFLADNGGCAEIIDRGTKGVPAGDKDSFLSYGVGWANASNTPFRLYKHWVHEGGISTPLIVRWPAVIKQSGMTSQPGHVIDLAATCYDVAGEIDLKGKGEGKLPLEGRSLVPIFRGQERTGHDYIFWEHEGNRAVRHQDWKLVARKNGEWELYDLTVDRTELRNLASDRADLVRQLSAQYEAWAKRVGADPN